MISDIIAPYSYFTDQIILDGRYHLSDFDIKKMNNIDAINYILLVWLLFPVI